jgi:SAM-dependent methyltransferase
LVVAEFDQIAEVYDETRRPLDEETVKSMREMLSKHDCRSILEIGVGTGRVSLPLASGGFRMTGVDISRRMMERASLKGLKNLVLAEGKEVPFQSEAFDATIMAHVFHILEDPMLVLKEAARVSRTGIFALVRKGGSGFRGWSWRGFLDGQGPPQGVEIDEATRKQFEERRQRFRAIAEKYGWSPDQRRARNWQWEVDIVQTHPPDDVKIVSDSVVNEGVEDRIARFEKGAFSSISSMPEEMRKEIIAEIRANAAKYPERTMPPHHEVYQLVMWKPETFLS